MSEGQAETLDVKTHYAAQVTADLERNAQEQQRILAEVAVLEAQLRALQHDQALLESMEQTLLGHGPTPAAFSGESDQAAGAVPRQIAAGSNPVKKKATTGARTKTKPAAKTPRSKGVRVEGQPTLGELIRGHLTGQTEPRSAAEITRALADIHPERPVKATVVRTTVEGLVAKGQVERSKQGASVFYSVVTRHDVTETQAVPEPEDAPN